MAASVSFHRNVYLLTQVVPASDEFKKHFREGMFDKPNTAGFIHASHYLLTIYDAERFKELIQWPVTCKKTEAKYRNDVRDYLTKIAMQNNDIGFPTILASHLFHASGIKFTTIMWKLSQVALRTHIKRQPSYDVMPVPKSGAAIALTKKFWNGTNARLSTEISSHAKTLSSLEEILRTTVQKERESLALIKTEIFEKEKEIAKCAASAPVHPLIKKRLTDISDTEVVQMWKAHVSQQTEQIAGCNKDIAKIAHLASRVYTVVASTSDAKTLDGKELGKLDVSAEIFLRENEDLHQEEKPLVLNAFLQLFSTVLKRVDDLCRRRNGLTDFSSCTTSVQATQEYLKSVLNICRTLLESIGSLSMDARETLNERRAMHDLDDTVSLPVADSEILMPSPHLNINTNAYTEEHHDLQSRLVLTPVESSHKFLFSRFVRHNQDPGGRLRPNLLLSKINLNETTLSSAEKQFNRSRKFTPKKVPFVRSAGRYTRLFARQTRRNNGTGNDSIISLPCTAKANSTAIANAIGEMRDISELSLDITVKSLCDISTDHLVTPEQSRRKGQDVSSCPQAKLKIPEIREITEVEITTSNGIVKNEQQQRRRSIGDLVERYKKLREASKHSQSPQISAIFQEDE